MINYPKQETYYARSKARLTSCNEQKDNAKAQEKGNEERQKDSVCRLHLQAEEEQAIMKKWAAMVFIFVALHLVALGTEYLVAEPLIFIAFALLDISMGLSAQWIYRFDQMRVVPTLYTITCYFCAISKLTMVSIYPHMSDPSLDFSSVVDNYKLGNMLLTAVQVALLIIYPMERLKDAISRDNNRFHRHYR